MTLSQIVPLGRKPAAERVADRLLDLVRTGNLRAGDKLPHENELASALQVSRPIVREALRGLSIMGVVQSYQGDGCYVTDLKPERLLGPLSFAISLEDYTIQTLFQARFVVDVSLAGFAAVNATAAQAGRLNELVKTGFTLATDPVAFRVMDVEFHDAVNDAAANPFLAKVGSALYQLAIDLRRIASEMPGVLDQSARDHAEIAAAIGARDAAAAEAAMRRHLTQIQATTDAAMVAVREARSAKRAEPA
jgi:GntR family transcriptional repressor for pyruvate dehydrogenase complex